MKNQIQEITSDHMFLKQRRVLYQIYGIADEELSFLCVNYVWFGVYVYLSKRLCGMGGETNASIQITKEKHNHAQN